MFRLHKKIQGREWTGKPAKVIDVCYIAIDSSWQLFTKAWIEESFFQMSTMNTALYHLQAYANEAETENNFLQRHKEQILAAQQALSQQEDGEDHWADVLDYHTRKLKNYPESGLNKDTELKPADFKKNAYLIATIKGTPEEVTKLLSLCSVETDFGKKILAVRDNSKTTFLVNPNAVLVEHKAVKEEEKPSLSKRSP